MDNTTFHYNGFECSLVQSIHRRAHNENNMNLQEAASNMHESVKPCCTYYYVHQKCNDIGNRYSETLQGLQQLGKNTVNFVTQARNCLGLKSSTTAATAAPPIATAPNKNTLFSGPSDQSKEESPETKKVPVQ